MSTLLPLLEGESLRRGLLADGRALTAEWCFALVRDMPYRRASSRAPEVILREWRGTCSGKHYLLAALFGELGLESRVIMCTHRFTPGNTRHFPAELRALLAAGPVPDVHTYLQVNTAQGWTAVDATWPSSAAPLGMPVNPAFQPGIDMTLACDPIDCYEVPAGEDPQQFKERLIVQFCGAGSGLRDDFIEGMGRWLGEST